MEPEAVIERLSDIAKKVHDADKLATLFFRLPRGQGNSDIKHGEPALRSNKSGFGRNDRILETSVASPYQENGACGF